MLSFVITWWVTRTFLLTGTPLIRSMIGGTGSDQLYGGDGSDIFKWQSGDLASGSVDTILDFQTGTGSGDHDTLELSL